MVLNNEPTIKINKGKEEVKRSVYLDEYIPILQTNDDVSIDLSKMKDDERLVFGWANVSIDCNGEVPIDWQGDITAPHILEKAAYEFVLKYRETGEMHTGEAKGYLVESIMFTKQKMEALGIPEGTIHEGWWIGFYIPDDEVFAKVKSGQYKMFSIQGKAKRLPIG